MLEDSRDFILVLLAFACGALDRPVYALQCAAYRLGWWRRRLLERGGAVVYRLCWHLRRLTDRGHFIAAWDALRNAWYRLCEGIAIRRR